MYQNNHIKMEFCVEKFSKLKQFKGWNSPITLEFPKLAEIG